MIRFEQVTKRYASGFDALKQVDFSLEKGEMVFLTGHSGAGKSTFLKLIALLERPTSGNIMVNGKKLHTLTNARDIAHHRQGIGVTFQTPTLLNNRNIFENVALPLLIRGEKPTTVGKRVQAALDMVGLLDKQRALPIHLSCGEQQRVGLARSIVHKPALLLADEPTGNLDPQLSVDIIRLFTQFNQIGVSVLIATHDLPLIARTKARMIVLKEGRVC